MKQPSRTNVYAFCQVIWPSQTSYACRGAFDLLCCWELLVSGSRSRSYGRLDGELAAFISDGFPAVPIHALAYSHNMLLLSCSVWLLLLYFFNRVGGWSAQVVKWRRYSCMLEGLPSCNPSSEYCQPLSSYIGFEETLLSVTSETLSYWSRVDPSWLLGSECSLSKGSLVCSAWDLWDHRNQGHMPRVLPYSALCL